MKWCADAQGCAKDPDLITFLSTPLALCCKNSPVKSHGKALLGPTLWEFRVFTETVIYPLTHLLIQPLIHPSIHTFILPSIHSIHPSIHPSLHHIIHPFTMSPCHHVPFTMSPCPSIHLSVHHLFRYLPINLLIHSPTHSFVHPLYLVLYWTPNLHWLLCRAVLGTHE